MIPNRQSQLQERDIAAKTLAAGAGDLPGNALQPGEWPGPITLLPSRRKWWGMSAGGAVVAIGLLVGAPGDTAAMVIAACFGLFALICASMLLPGAGLLRLDASGFQFSHFFRNKSFRWCDISNFSVCKLGEYGEVVAFETVKPLGILDRVDAALIGGRAYLPDTYGRTVEDLAQLMTNWRNWAAANK